MKKNKIYSYVKPGRYFGIIVDMEKYDNEYFFTWSIFLDEGVYDDLTDYFLTQIVEANSTEMSDFLELFKLFGGNDASLNDTSAIKIIRDNLAMNLIVEDNHGSDTRVRSVITSFSRDIKFRLDLERRNRAKCEKYHKENKDK